MDLEISHKKNIVLVIFRIITLKIGAFLVIPFLTKNLGAYGYGIWTNYNTILKILIPIVSLNLSYSMLRFIPSMETKSEKTRTFFSIGVIILFANLIISILIYLFKNKIANVFFGNNIEIVMLICFNLPLASLNKFFLDYLRAEKKIYFHSVISLFKRLGLIILAVFLSIYIKDIRLVMYSWLIFEIISFIILMILLFYNFEIKIQKFISYNKVKIYVFFTIPLLFSAVGNSILNFSDHLLISYYLDVENVGIYSVGYQFGLIISLLYAPFTFLLPSYISEYWDNSNYIKVNNLLNISMHVFLFLSLPAMIGLTVLSEQLIKLISTEFIASQAKHITFFSAFSYIMFGIQFFYTRVLFLKKETKIIGYLWIAVSVINIILNILLIPLLGITGAAFSTLISFIVMSLISIYLSTKEDNFKIMLNNTDILKYIISSIIMGVSVYCFNYSFKSTVSIVISILLGIIIYLFLLYILKEKTIFTIYERYKKMEDNHL